MLRQVGGYEVKTEGDAFMVSFPTATSALLWCFNVQTALLEQEWPDEILDSDNGREIQDSNGNVIYKGLSVRMGMHWGAPVCEPDPITGRMDYFGPIVNRAARISGEADGGQITVSSDFVSEVNRCFKAYETYQVEADPSPQLAEEIFGEVDTAQAVIKDLKDLTNKGYETKPLGERKLKGLENTEFISLMFPHSLAGRLQAKSAQKAISQPKLSVNPEDLYKLMDLSLRLEMLCSSLNTTEQPRLKVHSMELAMKLKDSTGETATDTLLMPLLEHVVTRIENCMSVLYLRRLLAPDPIYSSADETAAPLGGLLDMLEKQLGVKISGAAKRAATMAARGFEDVEEESEPESEASDEAVSPTTINSRMSAYTLNSTERNSAGVV